LIEVGENDYDDDDNYLHGPERDMVFGLGNIFYISLLLVNAIAVLSEERFLARSACRYYYCRR
jgi:Yos1-like